MTNLVEQEWGKLREALFGQMNPDEYAAELEALKTAFYAGGAAIMSLTVRETRIRSEEEIGPIIEGVREELMTFLAASMLGGPIQ